MTFSVSGIFVLPCIITVVLIGLYLDQRNTYSPITFFAIVIMWLFSMMILLGQSALTI